MEAFGAATDSYGMRVGDYDLNILLLYTWQLALKAKRVLKLDEIILGVDYPGTGTVARK